MKNKSIIIIIIIAHRFLHSEYSFIVFVGIHFCYVLFFALWNSFQSTINLPLFSLSYPIMRLYNLLFHESRGARFVNVNSVSFYWFYFLREAP